MKYLTVILLVIFPSIGFSETKIENINSRMEMEKYHLMVFEAMYGRGLKCHGLKQATPLALDSANLSQLMQLTDVRTVTRQIDGDQVRLKLTTKINKARMKKRKVMLPATEVLITVEGGSLVMTPSNVLFQIVSLEAGQITDRWIECK